MELVEIQKRLAQAQNLTRLYEPDTIERFIVPVLSILGWDVDTLMPPQLLRGNNNNATNRRFDVQLHIPNESLPAIVLECKSLNEHIVIEGKSAADNRNEKAFARQLRNYCLSTKHSFRRGYTVPVLTNGRQWYLFKEKFVDPRYRNEEISQQNWDDYVLVETALDSEDFLAVLQPHLAYKAAKERHETLQLNLRECRSS